MLNENDLYEEPSETLNCWLFRMTQMETIQTHRSRANGSN